MHISIVFNDLFIYFTNTRVQSWEESKNEKRVRPLMSHIEANVHQQPQS